MKKAPISEFKAHLNEYIDEVAVSGPMIIMRHGHPAAVIMSVPQDPEDLDNLFIALDPRFRELIRRPKGQKTVSHKEFWEKVKKTSRRR